MNGAFHKSVGTISGAVAAVHMAGACGPTNHTIIEVIGGALGGYVGGSLPDVLDPPTSPRHRDLGHSVLLVGPSVHSAVRSMGTLQEWLRSEADRRHQLQASATSAIESLFHAMLELLCRLGAGAIPGFVAGYSSHLFADLCTPAGLPLLGR